MTLSLDYQAIWQQARQHIVAKNYQKAYDCLSQFVSQTACADLGLDIIQVMMKCHQYQQAQSVLQLWLEIAPADHRFYGLQAQIDYSRGDYQAAKKRYKDLLITAPTEGKYWVNLAYCCAALEDLEQALIAFEKSSHFILNPDERWYYNYGMALLLQKQPQKALEKFRVVSDFYSNDREFCFHQALSYELCAMDDIALQCYEHNTKKWPEDLRNWHNLALLQQRHGLSQQSVHSLEKILQIEPEHPMAYPLYCALTGKDIPTLPSLFIKMLFDQYAFSYDQHLKEGLAYQAPLKARTLLLQACPGLQAGVVYDLGCGTGLLAPLVIDIATEIIGFDLSEGMLAQAKQKGFYNQLVTARLPQELAIYQRVPDYVFALELSNYLGADWELCVQRVSEILPPAGLFIFTAEIHEDAPAYLLQEYARYSYNPAWLERILIKTGFQIIAQESACLRQHKEQEVIGLYVVAQKT